MYDSSTDEAGEPRNEALVSTNLTASPEGYSLTLTPDSEFFARPGLVYPVTVDPTSSYSVSSDTNVRSDAATTSYGTSTVLRIGTPDGTAVARTLIRFGGTNGLLYKQIDSATLSLYENYAPNCTATGFNINSVYDSFSNSTTWNTRPDAGPTYASASDARGATGCSPAFVTASTGGADGRTLADLVQSWAYGWDNNGLMVQASSESSTGGYKKFDSSEAGSTAPTLSVTYEDGDINELLWDETVDLTTAEAIAATNPSAVDPEAMQLCPALDDDPETGLYPILGPSTDKDVQYEHDLLGDGSPTLDVYRPEFPGGTELPTYPAMILVHGGGFSRGCNHNIQREAAVAAGVSLDPDPKVPHNLSQAFIVFNINYRMACPTSDTDVAGGIFCSGYFSDEDPPEDHPYDNFPNGPGVHDVEAAIAWVQSHAGDYCPVGPDWETPCWNGKIELVGNSSGGNLAYEAAARLGPKTETNVLQVDALGSWSGALRLKVLSTGDWPCAKNQTSKYPRCQTAETNYIKCAAAPSTYPPPDACKQYYRDASPDDPDLTNAHPDTYGLPYLDPGLPRAYFANGTPDKDSVPTGKKEIISLRSAQDFRDDLALDFGWVQGGSGDTGAFRFCRVNEDLHAKTYIYSDPDPASTAEHHHCQDEDATDSVFEDMVSFLNSAVT